MNALFLRVFMLPSKLYRLAGADVAQLRAILQARLRMDERRPLSIGRASVSKKQSGRFAGFRSAFLSFFTGVMYVLPVLRFEASPLLALWMYFSIVLVMLSFLMITDFSNVLLDTRDTFILIPRPVSDRTLLLARILHIAIYLLRMVLPMALPGWILLSMLFGWRVAVWFPLPMALTSATALFVVMGMYVLMLQLASPVRFKNVLNGFQIFTTILLFSFYYLSLSLLRVSGLEEWFHRSPAWLRFSPSYWIASTVRWILPGMRAGWWYGLLALAFPLLALAVSMRFLAPAFIRKLSAIDAQAAAETGPARQPRTVGKRNVGSYLAALLNRSQEARASFLLAWIQTRRSRNFRMRVYPAFAYVPVYFVFQLYNNSNPSNGKIWETLPSTSMHLGLLYMSAFVLLQVQSYLMISEQYKASWIYQAVPMVKPGASLAGAFKAIYIHYFLPFFVVISLFVGYVWGSQTIRDIFLALINVTASALAIARFQYKYLPFSRQEQMREKGSRLYKVFGALLVPLILGFAHYGIHLAAAGLEIWYFPFVGTLLYGVCLLISLALLALLWSGYRNTSWEEIRVFDAEH